jgi:hypothetical protein
MTIRCGPNEKIRMLDAFDATAKNQSHLPIQCLRQKQFSKESNKKHSNHNDCKVHTSFTSACSGRENCTLHMQRIRLNSANDNCHNELVDYTMAFFECISGMKNKISRRWIRLKRYFIACLNQKRAKKYLKRSDKRAIKRK